jgi:hypothetical protein
MTVYAFNPEEGFDSDREYEHMFTLYDLNWFERRAFERLMRSTDRPHVVVTEDAWR